MRDYKNVKVPRTYRRKAQYVSVKRVRTGRASCGSGKGPAGAAAFLRFFMVIIIAAGCCWLCWQAYRAITHAELFQVAGVDVKGVKQLSETELKAIVGAFSGQNIFRTDLDAATRRAHANPWVKEARIYRRLPNRINMVFTERVPAAILDTGTGRFLIDDEGISIERLNKKEDASAWPLPVIAIRNCRPRPGEQVTSDALQEAFALISEISARGGWPPADVVIKADSPESLSVKYAEREFLLGSGNHVEKLRRLAEVMADVKERNLNIAYVDLRPERQVAVMVKTERDKQQGPRGKEKRL
ncbi:MAG TPA: FtsQ-type POTRA domain-containing protein [Nitrospirota bacterium]